jgi:AraC family transcriptional regulator
LFSLESVSCSRSEPGRSLGTSLSNGWTSVYLSAMQAHGESDVFEAEATPDQTLVVVTDGALLLSCFSNGACRSARRTIGSIGLTPGGKRSQIKWRALGTTFETAHIYLPQVLFSAGAELLRRVGTSPRTEPYDAISLSDPITSNLALALATAHRNGESDLLASSLGHALVLRLLCLERPDLHFREATTLPTSLRGARLNNVLDFMRENCGQPLTLERLSTEAALSRFHFVRAFKAAVGVSPHRHLLALRLERALEMLDRTEASIAEVAAACGFSSAPHLATAFKRRFSCTPSARRFRPLDRR